MGNLTHAIPYPRISAEDLDDPEWFAHDMALWSGRLGAIGRPIDPAELRDVVIGVAWKAKAAVMAVRRPFAPAFKAIQANQQWGLFGAVTERPDRLVIEVRRDGEWQRLYARLDPEHTWRDGVFRYRRVRGIWDSVRDEPKGTYLRLALWTAREIFVEDPQVDRVRFLLEQSRLTLPWEPVDHEVIRRAVREHRRERVLEDEGGDG